MGRWSVFLFEVCTSLVRAVLRSIWTSTAYLWSIGPTSTLTVINDGLPWCPKIRQRHWGGNIFRGERVPPPISLLQTGMKTSFSPFDLLEHVKHEEICYLQEGVFHSSWVKYLDPVILGGGGGSKVISHMIIYPPVRVLTQKPYTPI